MVLDTRSIAARRRSALSLQEPLSNTVLGNLLHLPPPPKTGGNHYANVNLIYASAAPIFSVHAYKQPLICSQKWATLAYQIDACVVVFPSFSKTVFDSGSCVHDSGSCRDSALLQRVAMDRVSKTYKQIWGIPRRHLYEVTLPQVCRLDDSILVILYTNQK